MRKLNVWINGMKVEVGNARYTRPTADEPFWRFELENGERIFATGNVLVIEEKEENNGNSA